MSRRAEIALTPEEALRLLEQERVVTCATLGRGGWPHLMPLWYVVREGELWAWTYARSQKVRNLERDDRCTLQVEAGDAYDELRGIMLHARAEIVRDTDVVAGVGSELAARYAEPAMSPELIARQAPKRVALRFREEARASWDHRKLR